ncbi:uncharacterized protein N7482_008309 [Penicillium canariense]|uniref:Yeast cell wall synthesis Kre9/Knh1-like N-terminal domain-containing protein n=1 Tax=Penicillium canariense TaxID=189055 RepID=A0A9W9HVI2_9EURO|nr:uncharacterized protein N7482_008309 [Penicillium canariense]KAJ5157209.1 hypothetical protein N7482_008309 [Penicillium canariense]
MRFAALVSTFAALAAAYTTPDYNKAPEGNPIRSPGLNEQVPEGQAYTIKWDPTLGKTISLVLLRGPSSNVVPKEVIAESIPNSGSFVWTPSTSLDPDVTHYGMLIVVEDAGANHGAYQWSTQFGLSAPAGSDTTTTTSSTPAATTTTTTQTTSQTAAPSSTPSPSKHTIVTVIDNVTTTYCPEDEASSSAAAQSTTVISSWEVTTTICPEETATGPVAPPTTTPVASTLAPGSSTLKSTPYVQSTATASPSASATPAFNAAGRNVISFGAVVAGLVAFMAL